jgi:PhnB protein
MSAALNPYLNFGGHTREAMEFYRSVLGGTLTIQTFAEFGAPTSPAYQDKVMHARLDADGIVMMASDAREGTSPIVGDNITLSLTGGPADRDHLTTVFDALADGGTTLMPLAEVPWGAVFGMLTDKLGIQWMVNIDTTAQ